jgi:hypothetical protein
MSRDTTVLPFRQREAIDDPLSELAREGARRMLAQVLIVEADSFVEIAGWPRRCRAPGARGKAAPLPRVADAWHPGGSASAIVLDLTESSLAAAKWPLIEWPKGETHCTAQTKFAASSVLPSPEYFAYAG